MRDGLRVDVDDHLAVPVDDQPISFGDLADHGGLDVPLVADAHEPVEVLGCDDRHHPLLRLAHEDLLGGEARIAQRHDVEGDVHAAVAGGGQFGCGARQAGGAEVLQGVDHPRLEQFERALDEQLLHERVAHLDARPLARLGGVEALGCEDRRTADAVTSGGRAVHDDEVAHAVGGGVLEVVVPQHPDAQRVDQRVARVTVIEDHLAADVGQPETVAVPADAGDDARATPGRCRGRRGGRTAAGP